jgi:hypothetical protein
MSLSPSAQLKQDCREIWRDYILRFPWEWASTHTFEHGINYFVARERFIKWKFRLIDDEDLRVGCYVMTSHKKGHLHLHGLLLGRNRHGKTLSDCSIRKYRDIWWTTNRTTARIEPVTDHYGACDYQALQYLGFKSDFAEPEPFGINLLQEVMEYKNDGLDFLEKL